MARRGGLEDLVRFCLEEIALGGEGGVSLDRLWQIVKTFDKRTSDLDRKYKAFVWGLLSSHKDFRAGDGKKQILWSEAEQWGRQNPEDAEEIVPESKQLHVSATKTLQWLALTGHDVDNTRVPPMEFTLLSIIGSNGPGGILQPDLSKLADQDKRSVPLRTKLLAEKGYIVKRSVAVHKMRTSLLVLRRFDNQTKEGEDEVQLQTDHINVEEFISKLMDLVRKHGIVSTADLRITLGIDVKKTFNTKLFNYTILALEKLGFLSRCRAESSYGTQFAGTHRCVKYVSELNEVGMNYVLRSYRSIVFLDLDNEITIDEGDNEDKELAEGEGHNLEKEPVSGELRLTEVQRIVPEWTPSNNFAQAVFDVIADQGTKGISSMELRDRLVGVFYKRGLESYLTFMCNGWQASKPNPLRHLSIIRDYDLSGRNPHYRYYTYENFSKLVDQGLAEWNTAMMQPNKNKKSVPITMSSEKGERPPWSSPHHHGFGFIPVDSKKKLSGDGAASLQACAVWKGKPKAPLARQRVKLRPLAKPKPPETPETPKIRRRQSAFAANTASQAPNRVSEVGIVPIPAPGSTQAPAVTPLNDRQGTIDSRETSPLITPRKRSGKRGANRKYPKGKEPYNLRWRKKLSLLGISLKYDKAVNAQQRRVTKHRTPRRINNTSRSPEGGMVKYLSGKFEFLLPHLAEGGVQVKDFRVIDPDEAATAPPSALRPIGEKMGSIDDELAEVIALVNEDHQPSDRMSVGGQQNGHTQTNGLPSQNGAVSYTTQYGFPASQNGIAIQNDNTRLDGASPGTNNGQSKDLSEQTSSTQELSQSGNLIQKLQTNGNIRTIDPTALPAPESDLWFERRLLTVRSDVLKDLDFWVELISPAVSDDETLAPSDGERPKGSRKRKASIGDDQRATKRLKPSDFELIEVPPRDGEEWEGNERPKIARKGLKKPDAVITVYDSDDAMLDAPERAVLPRNENSTPEIAFESDEINEPEAETPLSAPIQSPTPSKPPSRPAKSPKKQLQATTVRTAQIKSRLSSAKKPREVAQTSTQPTQAAGSSPPAASTRSKQNLQSEPSDVEMRDAGELTAPSPSAKASVEEDLENEASRKKWSKSTQAIQSIRAGMLGIRRRKVFMDMVNRCGGVCPADRGMHAAYRILWKKESPGSGDSDARTINDVGKGLQRQGEVESCRALLKHPKTGAMFERGIWFLSKFTKDSPEVKAMFRRIQESGGGLFFPEEAGLNISNDVLKPKQPNATPSSIPSIQREAPVKLLFKPRHIDSYIQRFPNGKRQNVTKNNSSPSIELTAEERREQIRKLKESVLRGPLGLVNLDSRHPRRPGEGLDEGPFPMQEMPVNRVSRRTRHSTTTEEQPTEQKRRRRRAPKGQQLEPELDLEPPLLPLVTDSSFQQPSVYTGYQLPLLRTGLHRLTSASSTTNSSQGPRDLKSTRSQLPYEGTVLIPTNASTLSIDLRKSTFRNFYWLSSKCGIFSDAYANPKQLYNAVNGTFSTVFELPDFAGVLQVAQDYLLPEHAHPARESVSKRATRSHDIVEDESRTEAKNQTMAAQRKTKQTDVLKNAGMVIRQLAVVPTELVDQAPLPRGRLRRRGHESTLSQAESDRLLFIFCATRTLLGGTSCALDWNLLLQIYTGYNLTQLRNAWNKIRSRNLERIPKLHEDFQEAWLRDYGNGKLPAIDLDHPELYDWHSLADWGVKNVFSKVDAPVIHLPATKTDLQCMYKVEDDTLPEFKEDFRGEASGILRRMASRPLTISLPIRPRAQDVKERETICKSLVLANTLTPESDYDGKLAKARIEQLMDESQLKHILECLTSQKVLIRDKPRRVLPGRNYHASDIFMTALKPAYPVQLLSDARQFATSAAETFAMGESIELSEGVSDGACLALLNLVAKDYVKLVPNELPTDQWGWLEGNYQGRHVDKAIILFPLSIERGARWDDPCNSRWVEDGVDRSAEINKGFTGRAPPSGNYDPPASIPPPFDFEALLSQTQSPNTSQEQESLPLWIDINNKLLPSMWSKAVIAVLTAVVAKPGITSDGLERVLTPALNKEDCDRVGHDLQIKGVFSEVGGLNDKSAKGWINKVWWWL